MNPLRIAILHYHLRGGGVTRIIEHLFESLKNAPVQLCVITGEETPADLSIPKDQIGTVKGLSYGKNNPSRDSDELLTEVTNKAKQLLGSKPDVWHVHNHSLGKNAEFTRLVLKLAKRGNRLLLHIHDFAEDNRPQNFKYLSEKPGLSEEMKLTEQLYPHGNHIHYTVLNGRDYKFLKETGFAENQLHLLSNPVSLVVDNGEANEDTNGDIPGKITLYPCRVIPRKNIGEFILWASIAPEDEQYGVTLAPKNEKYKTGYENWKSFVEQHNIPVVFEAGDAWNMSFPQLLKRADTFMTTSIAEGFGLIYLESWLAERPLKGRILPKITEDFKRHGIEFPGMYSRVDIPVSWLGESELQERLRKSITHHFKQYELNLTGEKTDRWLNKLMGDGKIDFAVLDREMQQKAIVHLILNPTSRSEIETVVLNEETVDSATIQKNKSIVQEEFSLEKFGERLTTIYESLQEEAPEPIRFIDSDSLLQKFLSPENFSLLRS